MGAERLKKFERVENCFVNTTSGPEYVLRLKEV